MVTGTRLIPRYGWRTIPIAVWLIIHRVAQRVRWRVWWLRAATTGPKGKRIKVEVGLKVDVGSRLAIGDDVSVGRHCVFEISDRSALGVTIGSKVWLSRACHIACQKEVSIGNHVLIGEFTSLRDSTHTYDSLDTPIWDQGDRVGILRIEDGVWIGRGCLIQGRPEVTVVGRGAIIGANSVVTKSVPPYEVWAGTPARFIRSRRGATGE
jgi:acetyltransferase-like isoleucine patch superfamily enzyme